MYNWTHLVQKRLSENPDASSFQVKNIFFRKEWVSLFKNFVANRDVIRYKSIVLQHTFRQENVTPQKRTKCIINPRKVRIAGIHTVHKTIEGLVDLVPATDALMYHYRKFGTNVPREKPIVTKKKVPKTRDTHVVEKYGLDLLNNLKKTWVGIEADVGLRFDLVKSISCQFITC